MAEYKNGVNFLGIMSVDKEDVTLDIATGRAVFVDDNKYDNDPSYAARVEKYVAEGFHRISLSGSSNNNNNSGNGEGCNCSPFILQLLKNDQDQLYIPTPFEEIYEACSSGRNVVVIGTGAESEDAYVIPNIHRDTSGGAVYIAGAANNGVWITLLASTNSAYPTEYTSPSV